MSSIPTVSSPSSVTPTSSVSSSSSSSSSLSSSSSFFSSLSSSAIDENLVNAILTTFDHTIEQNIRNRANEYVEQIKVSVGGEFIFLRHLFLLTLSGGRDEVKFRLLSLLVEIFSHRYQHYDHAVRAEIRNAVMVYVRDCATRSSSPSYINNKIATLLTKIIYHDYPQYWPNAFDDFIVSLNAGIEAVDIFICCLTAIDEEIVRFAEGRSQNVVDRNTIIKDSMRNGPLNNIVNACRQILITYHSRAPSMCGRCLSVLSEYIGWIDIGLVVNDDFLNLFYQLLTHSREHSIQSGTLDCLSEIVSKRMHKENKLPDGVKKLALLQRMNICNFIKTLPVPSDIEMCIHVAALLSSIGIELVDIIKTEQRGAPSSSSSSSAVVLNNDNNTSSTPFPISPSQTPSPLNPSPSPSSSSSSSSSSLSSSSDFVASNVLVGAVDLLEQTLDLCYQYAQLPDYQVAAELVEMFTAFVNIAKSAPSVVLVRRHTLRLYTILSSSFCYSDSYDFASPGDEEAHFNDHRHGLIKLLINLGAVDPDQVTSRVCHDFKNHITLTQHSPLLSIEATATLFLRLGEFVKNVAVRVGNEPFLSVLQLLFSANERVSHHPHPQVSIMYFELAVRYSRFFEIQPSYLTSVLTAFLDQRGIRSTHSKVAGRTSYLLLKLFESFTDALKKTLAPLADGIIAALQQTIQPAINAEQPTTHTPEKKKNTIQTGIPPDECKHLCGVLGIIISSTVVGDACLDYFSRSFAFFRSSLIHGQNLLSSSSHGLSPASIEVLCDRLSVLIECLGMMSKPLTRDGPRLVVPLTEALHLTYSLFSIVPSHEGIRSRSLFFFHRCIECIPQAALERLPQLFHYLLSTTSASNITPTVQLLVDVIGKYKESFAPALDVLLLPVCERVYACLRAYSHLDSPTLENEPQAAHSADLAERAAIQKTYFKFLQCLVSSGSFVVLISPRNRPHTMSILSTVTDGLLLQKDHTIYKTCFAILRAIQNALIAEKEKAASLSSSSSASPSSSSSSPSASSSSSSSSSLSLSADALSSIGEPLADFLIKTCTQAAYKWLADNIAQIEDANFDSCVREMAEFQRSSFKLFGNQYAHFLANYLVSYLNLATSGAGEYVSKLAMANDVLHAYIRHILAQKRIQQLQIQQEQQQQQQQPQS